MSRSRDPNQLYEDRELLKQRVLIQTILDIGGMRLRNENDPDSEKVYKTKADTAIMAIADLQRTLRRQDKETHDIHLFLGKWRVFQDHLVPVLTANRDNPEMVMAAAKLMYMLTTPANPESTTVSEQIAYLQSYKECILNSEVIAVFVVLLSDVLGVEPHLRAPDEVARCELLLWLLRNLAAVPDPAPAQDPAAEPNTRLHSRLIEMLAREHFFELFVIVIESMDDEEEHSRSWSLLLLDVLYFLLRGETPAALVDAMFARSSTVEAPSSPNEVPAAHTNESSSTHSTLSRLRQRTRIERRVSAAAASARHSKFGGTVVVPRAGGAGSVRCHDVSKAVNSASSDALPKLKPLARQTKKQGGVASSRLSPNARRALAELCSQLLGGGLTVLLHAVEEEFVAEQERQGGRVVVADKLNRAFVAGFFIEFHTRLERRRLASLMRQPATDLADQPVFQLAPIGVALKATQFLNVLDLIAAFAQEKQWRPLAVALCTFDQMLQATFELLRSRDDELLRIVQHVLYKTFYEIDHPSRRLHVLLRNFKPNTHPRALIHRMIETTHTYLKVLAAFERQQGRALFVKSTKGGSTMKRIRANDEQTAQEEAAQQLAAPSSTSPSKPTNATNTNVDDTVTDNAAVVPGTDEEHEHSTTPNDDNTSSTTDVNVDKQPSSEVVVPNEPSSPSPIASNEVDAAPIMSNTANNDDNNNNNNNAEDDDNKDANNNNNNNDNNNNNNNNTEDTDQRSNNNDDDDERSGNTPETINTETNSPRNNDDDADGDRSGNEEPEVKVDAAAEAAVDALEREEVERDREVVRERELTTLSEVKRFAHPHVMQNYVFALSRWRDISDELLHKIVKMFVRIARDCELPALFYNAPMLRVFHAILTDPLVTPHDPRYKDLLAFIHYVLQLLFDKMRHHADEAPQMALELLFSHTRDDLERLSDRRSEKQRLAELEAEVEALARQRSRDEQRKKRAAESGDESDSSSVSSDEEADENTNDDDGDSAATMVPVQRLKAGAQLEWSEAHDTELRSLWTENLSEELCMDIVSAMHSLQPTPPQVWQRLIELNVLKRGDARIVDEQAFADEMYETVMEAAPAQPKTTQRSKEERAARRAAKAERRRRRQENRTPRSATKRPRLDPQALREADMLNADLLATDLPPQDDDTAEKLERAVFATLRTAKRSNATDSVAGLTWLATRFRAAAQERAEDDADAVLSVPFELKQSELAAATWFMKQPCVRRLAKTQLLLAYDSSRARWLVKRGVGAARLNATAKLLEEAVLEENAAAITLSFGLPGDTATASQTDNNNNNNNNNNDDDDDDDADAEDDNDDSNNIDSGRSPRRSSKLSMIETYERRSRKEEDARELARKRKAALLALRRKRGLVDDDDDDAHENNNDDNTNINDNNIEQETTHDKEPSSNDNQEKSNNNKKANMSMDENTDNVSNVVVTPPSTKKRRRLRRRADSSDDDDSQ